MERRQKVLIADCDPDLLIVLEKFLEEAGFDTTTTWDGREAKSLIDSQRFDAAVIGQHTRSVHCAELLKGLYRKGEDTLCIVLETPGSQAAELGDSHFPGVSAVISKWNLKDVVEMLCKKIHAHKLSVTCGATLAEQDIA